jgi:hypothetical protein
MKILIALDIGEIKPIKDDDKVVVGKYSPDYQDVTVGDLLGLNGPGLKHGEVICFDGCYMKHDREDESFYEAEFHGVLEI